MRKQGEGALFRVPADKTKPLKYWQATIELPTTDGGRRRKFIRAKDQRELLKKLDQAKKDLRARGDLHTADMSTEQWFTYWLEQIVAKTTRPNTAANYRIVTTHHILPIIGKVKLEKLTPAHIRKVTANMETAGLSTTYALNAHRVMSRSLEIAMREGRVGRNVAKLMDAPRKATHDAEAFTVDEAIQVLQHVATDQQMGARWATSLLTGARRGEVIGLELDRVGDDLDLSWQLQRIIWSHGCGAPTGVDTDGKAVHRCKRKRGTDCPDRRLIVPSDYEYRHIEGGLYWTRPKSNAGWRIIPLVEPLRSIIERRVATMEPNPYGLLFTLNGDPLDPNRDTARWKEVLAETGIQKDVVLHGLRHTVADLLYAADVPEDVIVQILGHTTRATSRGYKSKGTTNRPRMLDAFNRLSALVSVDAPPLAS